MNFLEVILGYEISPQPDMCILEGSTNSTRCEWL